jgi:hypothetical protein
MIRSLALLRECRRDQSLMDIDTAIEQLRAVMEVKKGELVDAVSAAPKLLQLARYKKTDDRQKLLASDIEAAIARLPPDVAEDANNLLPITNPGSYLSARWNAIGAAGYSSPAKRWRWTSVFGRVAVELLSLQEGDHEQLSYRVLDLHLDVNVTYQDSEQHRITSFEWIIESTIPDMRWFGFTHNVHDLKVSDWECQIEGHAKVGHVPVRSRGEDGEHWYVVSLGKTLPMGKPVSIKTAMHAVGPRGKFPWLSYTLPGPIEKLLLTVDVPRDEATKFICQELEVRDVCSETDHRRDGDATMSYEPISPRKGRTYRLEWRT